MAEQKSHFFLPTFIMMSMVIAIAGISTKPAKACIGLNKHLSLEFFILSLLLHQRTLSHPTNSFNILNKQFHDKHRVARIRPPDVSAICSHSALPLLTAAKAKKNSATHKSVYFCLSVCSHGFHLNVCICVFPSARISFTTKLLDFFRLPFVDSRIHIQSESNQIE